MQAVETREAGPLGLEPRIADPESAVLPITPRAILAHRFLLRLARERRLAKETDNRCDRWVRLKVSRESAQRQAWITLAATAVFSDVIDCCSTQHAAICGDRVNSDRNALASETRLRAV